MKTGSSSSLSAMASQAREKEPKSFSDIPWEVLAPHVCDDNFLGAGGFGSVYKGRWEGHPVAIKVLDTPRLAKGREREAVAAAFLSELNSLARAAGSSFIVRLYGACVPGPEAPPGAQLAIVTELAEGGPSLTSSTPVASPSLWRRRLSLLSSL